MAITPLKSSQITTWVSSDGRFSVAEAYNVRESGYSGLTLPGRGDVTINYGYGNGGQPVVRSVDLGTPGAPSITLDSFLGTMRDRLMEMHLTGEVSWIQERAKGCGSVPDNPFSNDIVFHLEYPRTGDVSIGDKDSNFSSTDVTQTVPFTSESYAVLFKGEISALTTSETADANAAWIADWSKDTCGSGYVGPDKIAYIACDAGSSATPNVLYTSDSGSTWAATSADPFTTNDEHANFIQGFPKSDTQFRIIVGRTVADASNPPEIAYSTVTYGDEGTTVWTQVDIGSTNNETVTAVYVASAQNIFVATSGGEIYRSTDQGESFSGVYDGTQMNAFAIDYTNGNLYAAGASNVLLRSTDDGASWSAITGPTGSNASTAIYIANDAIWLGNGTAIFYTEAKKPSSANQWTSQKDFGSNHSVKTIDCKGKPTGINGGSSQLVELVVSDSSGNEGDVWKTFDGGETWEEVTNVTNSGYGLAYFSKNDDNFCIIPGEDDTSTAVIHKYAAA